MYFAGFNFAFVGRGIHEFGNIPEPLLYEMSNPGTIGYSLPESDVPHTPLPTHMMRADLNLPEVGEVDVVRHFTRLSQKKLLR